MGFYRNAFLLSEAVNTFKGMAFPLNLSRDVKRT